MPLDAAVRARLKPMLLLLSSDIEGERAAAAAAVTRTLKASNADWHDLADALTEEKPAPAPSSSQRAPEPRLRERGDGRFEIEASELVPLVQAVREHVHIDDWTDQFLTSMEERAIRFPTIILTEKQIAVLTRLIDRIPT